MLWAWADAAGPRGSAPAKGGASALAECGKVFLASDGGLEELPPALVDIHTGSYPGQPPKSAGLLHAPGDGLGRVGSFAPGQLQEPLPGLIGPSRDQFRHNSVLIEEHRQRNR